jgi:hypothetical protein
MKKLQRAKFKKKLFNKWVNKIDGILRTDKGFRLLELQFINYKEESLNTLYANLITMCSINNISISINEGSQKYNKLTEIGVIEIKIKEDDLNNFVLVWKSFKSKWIKIRRDRIISQNCTCTNLEKCRLLNCDCSCHDEDRKINVGMYNTQERKFTLAEKIIVSFDTSLFNKFVDESINKLNSVDLEYICLSCNNTDKCKECYLTKKLEEKSEKEKELKYNIVSCLDEGLRLHKVIDIKYIYNTVKSTCIINSIEVPTFEEIQSMIDKEILFENNKIFKVDNLYMIDNKKLIDLVEKVVDGINTNWENINYVLSKETEIILEYIIFNCYDGKGRDIDCILEKIVEDFTLIYIENIISNGEWYFQKIKELNIKLEDC